MALRLAKSFNFERIVSHGPSVHSVHTVFVCLLVFWEKRIGFRIRSVSARRGHLCGSPSINTCRTTRFSPLLSRLSLGLSRDPYNAICTFRFCKKHFPCFDPKKRNGYTVENERKEDAFGMEGAARFRAFCLFCIRTTYYNNKVH